MKPNKQKTDWVEDLNKVLDKQNAYVDWAIDGEEEYKNNVKDFISQLLKTQREEIIKEERQKSIKVVWNNVCEQIRRDVISEIIDLVKENRKGTFTDDGGNDCWYINDLVKELKLLENK